MRDRWKNDKSFRRRLIAVGVVAGLVLLLFLLRLGQVQLGDDGAFQEAFASSSSTAPAAPSAAFSTALEGNS